ncbi:histidine kinase [Intrasporangium sp.]|uniref:sensor histidine kinase n=1 Tax=Intrasporangium sp. TaxID=1925024 RepID=UPI0033657F57
MSQLTRPRVPRLDPRLFDALVAVGLFVVLVLSFPGPTTTGLRPADAGAWALALGLSMPYAAHRRLPWLALVVALGSLVTWALLHYAPYPGIGALVLLFGLTLHGTRRASLVAFSATVATLAVSLALQPAGVVVLADWISSLLAACVAWLAADNLRQRRARWAALEERALLLEREREERERAAVAAERLRIARELHDVVAHSMSVIAVQAGVGSHVIDQDVASAKAALATIETTSRDALAEMRRMLGVLRDGTEPVEVQPVHGLADLPSLAAQMRRTGLGVTLEAPTGTQVPACVDLTAYRVVQEALTNVLKHGGPVAHVRVGIDDELVTIEVTDDGSSAADSGPAGPAGPASPAARVAVGSGQGLAGMRERLSLYGGTFEAGPQLGGGFRVLASLPRDASAS